MISKVYKKFALRPSAKNQGNKGSRSSGTTESVEVGTIRRIVAVAIGAPREGVVVVPRTTPINTVGAARIVNPCAAVGGCAIVTIMPVVLAPLGYIPRHVVTPRRTECSSLTCHIASPVGPPSRYEITPLTVQPEGYSPRRMAGCLPSTLSSTNPLKLLPEPVWSRHDHMYMISRVIFCHLYLQ